MGTRIGNKNRIPHFRRRGDSTAPILRFAEVGNVADDKIVLTYRERLDETSTPATGDGSVSGTSETIASVAVSGRTVTWTMTGVILETETITIDYTAGTNPIRDRAENNAANLVGQAVTNNTQNYLRDHDGDLILDHDGDKIPI